MEGKLDKKTIYKGITATFFCLVILLFMGIPVSAWEWDNLKSFDKATKTVTYDNSFLRLIKLDQIAKVTLNTPMHNYVMSGKDVKVAEMTIDITVGEYTSVFGAMKFYSKDYINIKDKKFTYKYAVWEDAQDPVIECDKELWEKEMSTKCWETGEFRKTKVQKWYEFDPTQSLKQGVYTIGIFTDVSGGEVAEWIPTLFGIETQEFAWYQGLNKYDFMILHDNGDQFGQARNASETFQFGSINGFVGCGQVNVTILSLGVYNSSGTSGICTARIVNSTGWAELPLGENLDVASGTWTGGQYIGGYSANSTVINMTAKEQLRCYFNYSIILTCPSASTGSLMLWDQYRSANNYTTGKAYYQTGGTWTAYSTNYDNEFQVWGINWTTGGGATPSTLNVSTLSPANETLTLKPNYEIKCNATSNYNIMNMSVWANSTGTWTEEYFFAYTTFENSSNYTVTINTPTVYACVGADNSSVTKWGENRTINKFNSTLQVNLTAPADAYSTTASTFPINCTVGSNYNISNIQVWINNTGSWYNYANSTIPPDVTNVMSIEQAIPVPAKWSCRACDWNSNCVWATTNRTINKVSSINFTLQRTAETGDVTCTMFGNENVSNVSLYTNTTGTWARNMTARMTYDDFNDANLDALRWKKQDAGASLVSEHDGIMEIFAGAGESIMVNTTHKFFTGLNGYFQFNVSFTDYPQLTVYSDNWNLCGSNLGVGIYTLKRQGTGNVNCTKNGVQADYRTGVNDDTLQFYVAGSWNAQYNIDNVYSWSFPTNNTNISKSYTLPFIWNCYGCLIDNTCAWAGENMTAGTLSNFIERSQTYSATTIEGAIEDFEINFTFNQSNYPTATASLIYAGSSYAGVTGQTGQTRNYSTTVNIPSVNADTTNSFYWQIFLSNSTGNIYYNSSIKTQLVRNMNITDDCSSSGKVILNMSLKDEETLALLNTTTPNSTTIEIDLQLTSRLNASQVFSFAKKWTDNNNVAVCVPPEILNSTSYKIEFTAGYSATNHVQEFYYLDNGTLDNTIYFNPYTDNTIDLLDLKTADSTTFLFTFTDEDGLKVDDAIVHTYRKYIGDGVFREAERSRDDNNGETHVHLVEEDVIYYFMVSQYGTIIFTSNTYNAKCLSTPCEISLSASPSETNWSLIDGDEGRFSITVNPATRIVTTSFLLTNSSVVNVSLYKFYNGVETLLNTTSITAMTGSLSLHVPLAYDNGTFFVAVWKNNALITSRWIALKESAKDYFGTSGAILGGLILLTIVLMAVSEGVGLIIFTILGIIVITIMQLVDMSWLAIISIICAGGIIIWKLVGRRKNA